MDIREEKLQRFIEMTKALNAVAVGVDATGKVSPEMMEAANVILSTGTKTQLLLRTPATGVIVRCIERTLDSLFVAEVEQTDPIKRKRAVGEILDRISRAFIALGMEDPKLADAVHVELPKEA